jgi:excinuclease ABC subunit A
MDVIRIRGARTHNLKNVDLDLPRQRLIVITGLSGSGKSSLAFDTIYAEGQRRYVESLSAYARQFLSMMEKPDVDAIEGLSPAISIDQKASSHNPRSTVGTITEIYDYLRLLYARAGTPRCPEHGHALTVQTVSEMVDATLALDPSRRYALLAPLVRERKGEHREVFERLAAQGFERVRVDGMLRELGEVPALDGRRKHTVEVVVDRFRPRRELAQRLAESFETALALSEGLARVVDLDDDTREELLFSARFACPVCDYALAELEPRLFSFNSPVGACPACDGLGVTRFFDPDRVVADPGKSLAEGAIRGFDRRNPFAFALLEALARHFRFSLEQPWNRLPESARRVILHGSGGEAIAWRIPGAGRTRSERRPFEGVLAILERRYRETDSPALREELSHYIGERPCPQCGGERLCRAARHVEVAGVRLPELVRWPVRRALEHCEGLALPGWRGEIAAKILKEIRARLRFLVDVGLDYLSLDRRAETLSGGEAQRIRLASQIGAGLSGVLYVLDEPSIGLHQRDNARLIETLKRLRDLGNTVLVVEHDEETIRAADHLVDIGPGAGQHGGRIVAEGGLDAILRAPDSLTGDYLAGRRRIALPRLRQAPQRERWLRLYGARGNNLRSVDLRIPVGLLVCVTGVSGSGKSTLINDTLYRAAARALHRAGEDPAPFERIEGLEHFDQVVDIDQSPIGRTPRSNPATYTGLFTPIRELFAQVPEARARGYKPGRFSFNLRGGRCEACEGDGLIKVEMHFLPDVYVTCDVCQGRRYNRETLEIRYKGLTIHEVLELTVEEALSVFAPVPAVAGRLLTLSQVGLGYIKLGQPATTLSGGEAQRVKLARELSRRDSGRTLYILDEPTTGLHFHDIAMLLEVLLRLRDRGNTVVVIEHNLDVIKCADWIVDLGPEGGEGGGRIVAEGTPEQVAACKASHTGRFLAALLERERARMAA